MKVHLTKRSLRVFFTSHAPRGALLFLAALAMALLIHPSGALAAAPYSIFDNATGGDCTQIGTWDNGTKTCTLNQNISVSGTDGIIIESNGLTLDGNGHTLANNDNLTSNGVFIGWKSNISVKNLVIMGFYDGIDVSQVTGVIVTGNAISGSKIGIFIGNLSSGNTIYHNVITSNEYVGTGLSNSSNNIIYANVISNNGVGLNITTNSKDNLVFNNNFINSSQVFVDGSTGNVFNVAAPIGGNYWSDHATPSQGCANVGNDRFCDAPYSPIATVTDNLPLARRGYYFTWYDMASTGARDWVLMANPIQTSGEDAWFDLSIAGVQQTLPTISQIPGQVPPLGTITPTYHGIINGPVDVGYHARMRTMVSQRILWGDSLEEVVGTDAARLSDHYYWTWYDMMSGGFKNWILVGNPSATDTVTAYINFRDVDTGIYVTETHNISPGGRWTPTYPGKMGGPVEVKAYIQNGSWSNPADRRDVIASQRVLSNGDSSFNEVPGIPAEELTDRYMWTWYDNVYAQNWILIANPPDSGINMDYSIYIHGQGAGGGVGVTPGQTAIVMIPGKIDGPVEVLTSRSGTGIPLNSIVSQRTLWGPSFEEVPGFPYSSLSSFYYWTWYDQQSAGVSNWVQVANPDGANQLHYEITIAGQDPAPGPTCSKGTLAAGEMTNCQFPGTMNGPVKVQAWNLIKTAPMDIVASQRVLWNGYFNEVMGTELS